MHHHQLRKQVQAVQVSGHLHPPLRLWIMDPACWLWKKGIQAFWKPRAWANFLASPTWSTRPATGCGARSTSSWVHRILFWQLSSGRNLHGSGMSPSPKSSFRVLWRVGDAVVGRRNAGGTTSKSGHSCQCQNCSQRSTAEKTGMWSLLYRPSCPPDDPVGQGAELNWTELNWIYWTLFSVHDKTNLSYSSVLME